MRLDMETYMTPIDPISNIGYVMAIFGFGDALAASIVGNLSDKYGKKIFLILATIIQLTCCGLFFYLGKATHEYPSFIILSSIAFGWGVVPSWSVFPGSLLPPPALPPIPMQVAMDLSQVWGLA